MMLLCWYCAAFVCCCCAAGVLLLCCWCAGVVLLVFCCCAAGVLLLCFSAAVMLLCWCCAAFVCCYCAGVVLLICCCCAVVVLYSLLLCCRCVDVVLILYCCSVAVELLLCSCWQCARLKSFLPENMLNYIFIVREHTYSQQAFEPLIYSMAVRARTFLNPNSWMSNFVEVSGHNLESSQTWGFCMDFLNHREGGKVFLSVFSHFSCKV
jgi:hypothetical protein